MELVDEEKIKHIAKLAKININEEETKILSKQVEQILEYVEQLNEIDENIEPLDNLTGNYNRFREDVVLNFENKEKIIENAPKNKDGFILVPKVLDN